MEIRKATLDDLEAISALYKDFYDFNAHLHPDYYQRTTNTASFPKMLIEGEDSDVLVAQMSRGIVGFASVHVRETRHFDNVIPRRYAELIDIEADVRGQGVGSALIEAVRDWAKERDLDFVELSVLTGNNDAIRLYERLGFEVQKLRMRMHLD